MAVYSAPEAKAAAVFPDRSHLRSQILQRTSQQPVSKTYNNIKNSVIRQLRFGFKLSATGSVCVNEPKFSSMSSGTISITPVSAVDGSDKMTYIYPGESFWMKDGMFSYTERSVTMKSPEDTAEKKRTGAVNIKVSPPTAKRG